MKSIELLRVASTKQGLRFARVFGLARALGLAGVACIVAASTACVYVDAGGDDGGECQTDADCADNPDGKTQCNSQNVCVTPPNVAVCTSNADCLGTDLNAICRKSDQVCVTLRSPECQTVVGDITRDDALMIGGVLPTAGPDVQFGQAGELAIELAVSEILTAGGIPSAAAGMTRPIVFIGCNDGDGTQEAAIKAAKHLAEDLEIPAIIGHSYSGSTLSIANEVTIKNGTLLISPSATSDAITTLIDNDLVWRTSPPDSLQSAALKLYVPEVESLVRNMFVVNQMPFDTPVKLAVINNTDTYGLALAEALVSGGSGGPLKVNGLPVSDPSNAQLYKRLQYEDGDVGQEVNIVTEMAEQLHPNIIVLFGYVNSISIITSIESSWTGDPQLMPRYVLSDGALSQDLMAATQGNDSLRGRITGTVFGPSTPRFQTFIDAYNAKYPTKKDQYPASVFGAAGAYDAVYLLAYAKAATTDLPDSGTTLATGLKIAFNPAGMAINAGGADAPMGFAEIQSAGSINYRGASGELDFDSLTGEAPSDVQIWCVPSGQLPPEGYVRSGLFYSAETKALSGVLTPCN